MIKKILLILGVLAISTNVGYSATFDNFRCAADYEEPGYGVSNLTGVNFFAERIGDVIIRKSILKNSKGKYKANLQSYNISSLKKGIFKSLEVKGTDTVTDGIYISNMKLKSLCNYNYIEVDNKYKVATFQEPFAAVYAFQFTEEDLNKTMQSAMYKEIIRKLNNIGNSSKMFNISSTSAKIEDDKLFFTFRATLPLLKLKQDITIETGMKVRNGEIVLNDAKLVTDSFKLDMSRLEKVINYLNPLEFSMNVFDGQYVNTKIQEVTIKDNKINLSGIMMINEGTQTEL